jgi:thiol-disulfide isomerase/thioredoxin
MMNRDDLLHQDTEAAMRRAVHHGLALAVLLFGATAGTGTAHATEERGGLPEGWKTTVPMPDRLWGAGGRYLIWVEGGWLQVRRETSDGQTDWHIVLARATDPTPPIVKEPGRPPEGNLRFEVTYRDGRFFVREDLNVLRAVREPKPAEPAAWPAIKLPDEQRSRMGWGRSPGPPPLQVFQGFVEPWFLYASGPGDERFDCWLRLTPTALVKDEGNGVEVFASGLIQAWGGKNRVFDDGAMLLAVRSSEAEARVVANLAIGAQAPGFAVKTLDGKPLALDDYRGKYVLLDFWATWCGPCVAELPALQDVQAAFGSDDRFVLISLSLDRQIEVARRFVKDRGLSWVQAFVGDEAGEQVLEDYGADTIPATFLIGPDGKVLARGMRGDAIMVAVKKALGKP